MSFVDFVPNQPETRFPRFEITGLVRDSTGSPFLLPTFHNLLQPPPSAPAPPPPHSAPITPHCPNCFLQCNPFTGLCTNCPGRFVVPPTPHINNAIPSLDQDSYDSLTMSDVLNVVDDLLRDDNPPEPQITLCSGCGRDSLIAINCQGLFLCSSCLTRHPTDHEFSELASNISNSTSPKTSHSPHSPISCFSDCSQEEVEDEGRLEFCGVHVKEKIRYFCQPCMSLLCYSCISNGHQHHAHTTIKEAYERVNPSLDSITNSTAQKLKLLDSSLKSGSDMRERIIKKKEEAIEKVQRVFQSYRDAISRREKDLIDQIAVLTDLRLKSLSKEGESNERVRNALKGFQKKMKDAKQNGRKASAVLLYHNISKQLEEIAPDNNTVSHLPIEDDSFLLKTSTANLTESLKSLCVLTTAPYPPLCSAVGDGLFHPRVNRSTTVLVTTKDRTGEPCSEGGEQLVVSLRAHCGSLLPAEWQDNKDGSYSIRFRPRVRGEHQLSISIRGHHIKGSPFTLHVDGGREYNHFGIVKVFGGEGTDPGQFCRPWGITCDQKGNIIVGDRSNHRIQVFNSNGVLKAVFGSEGTGQGQFNRPAGVAVTREGHIVVADKDNHRIQVLKIDGTFLFKFGSKGGNDGQMIYPYDVAVNQIDGRIAVTDTGNHRLLIFSHEGALLGKFGYKGYLCGHFDSPRGIAFNDEGHIIVSDFNVHHILVIHPDGTTARILGSQGAGNGQFMRPQGIAVDHMGNFVIADTRNNRIVIMHPCGHFVGKLGTTGSGQGELDRPTSVAVLPDGRIAVVDFGNSRVQIF